MPSLKLKCGTRPVFLSCCDKVSVFYQSDVVCRHCHGICITPPILIASYTLLCVLLTTAVCGVWYQRAGRGTKRYLIVDHTASRHHDTLGTCLVYMLYAKIPNSQLKQISRSTIGGDRLASKTPFHIFWCSSPLVCEAKRNGKAEGRTSRVSSRQQRRSIVS